MAKFKKILIIFSLLFVMIFTNNRETNASAYSTWESTNQGWKYIKSNGYYARSEWIYIRDNQNSSWKYFDAYGVNREQFYNENGNTWLSKEGPNSGYHKGWWTNLVNDQTYYFRQNSGTMVKGRQYIDGDWTYFRNSGTRALGWQYYDNSWKYYDMYDNGHEISGQWKWLKVKGNKYNWKFFNEYGENVEQFFNENGNTWLSTEGPYDYHRGWWTNPINGHSYFFRIQSGTMVKGRQYIDDGWTYFRSSGTHALGWQYYDGSWKYIDAYNNGHETTDSWKWLKLNNGKYNWKYFNENGENIDNFYKENGNIWLSTEGPYKDYHKGWWINPEDGLSYYFRETSGTMVTGKQYIDGLWFNFSLEGALMENELVSDSNIKNEVVRGKLVADTYVRISPNGPIIDLYLEGLDIKGTAEKDWIRLDNGFYIYKYALDDYNDLDEYDINKLREQYPDNDEDRFIYAIANSAIQATMNKDIYTSVMMAQAILESGWGRSKLSLPPNHNLFGVKGDYEGNYVEFFTKEDDGTGKEYVISAKFRKYPTYKESFDDNAAILTGYDRTDKWLYDYYYGARVSQTKSYKEATQHLQGRYATSTIYASTLNSLIEQFNLTRFDDLRIQFENSNR